MDLSSPAGDPRPVTVAICTFRRPTELERLLQSLCQLRLEADRWEVVEILVVDNAPEGDEHTTLAFPVSDLVRYVHEPTVGVSAARNCAIDQARGDILVFIDDDEMACEGWPDGLIDVVFDGPAALVGGPVLPQFDDDTPDWIRSGGFFERDNPPHLTEVDWLRTGNLAIDLLAVRAAGLRFDMAFNESGGEDAAFSRAAADAGLRLLWSRNGSVLEPVTPERATRSWLQQRERLSTSNHVRSHRSVNSLGGTIAQVLPRATFRLVQGGVTWTAARATGDQARVLRSSLHVYRALGSMDGLVSCVREGSDVARSQ